jgi:hypothetical protein
MALLLRSIELFVRVIEAGRNAASQRSAKNGLESGGL